MSSPAPTPRRPLLRGMALAALVIGSLCSGGAHGAELDIESELAIPGVKLLVVDFFASWCGPCMEAVPKWEALRKKYGSRGLRLVVVAVKDDAEMCRDVPWTPDKLVCDVEGELAQRFGVDGLPAAFVWSWQGNMLGERVHPDDVERQIEDWMLGAPRVMVEVSDLPKTAGIRGRTLERMVSSELSSAGKLTVVASRHEQERLRALAKDSFRPGADERLTCKLGREVSANNLLEVSMSPGKNKQLRLGLLSAESHCRTRTVSSPWDPERPEVSVAKAVTKLMGKLRRPELQRPMALQMARRLEPDVEPAPVRAQPVATVAEPPPSKPVAVSPRPARVEPRPTDVAPAPATSFQEAQQRAQAAEARAREAREEADRLQRQRKRRLKEGWVAVDRGARDRDRPHAERLQIVDRFLAEFPTDNPYAEKAGLWRASLAAGLEPGERVEGRQGRIKFLPRDGTFPRGISHRHVGRSLKRGLKAMTACYQAELDRVPALAGTVAFDIVLHPDGAIADVRVKLSTLGARSVERCMVDVVRTLSFRGAGGSQPVVVTYPMMLYSR